MNYQFPYVIEPTRLKLIWQSSGEGRKNFVVGEVVRIGETYSLSYFRLSVEFMEACANGFSGHPAFTPALPVHHENVMEVLSKRLPPRNRNDFAAYLWNYGLYEHQSISNFALLGYTGGRLPGDGFSFAIDFNFQNLPYQFLMRIAGFGYYDGMKFDRDTLMDSGVEFVPDTANEHDPYAVKIAIMGFKLGFVPRYYSYLFRYWLVNCKVTGRIVKVEGTFERPRIFLAVEVAPRNAFQLT